MTEAVRRQIPARVLLVDDERNILRSLERLLIGEDIDILTAGSGAEGLEILGREPDVGLIVSDQRMPVMNGTEFLERSRELAPEALRILLTGYADLQASIDAINRGGACRYLTKPWDDADLVQAIRDALHQYRLERENRELAAIVERQNEELKEWNRRLKSRVLQQTAAIGEKNQALQEANSRLKDNFRATLESFSRILEMRARQERDHSRSVAELSRGLAEELGLAEEAVEEIYAAALLHDIGKLGTPDRLLGHRPEDLAGEDREIYLRHALGGQTAVDGIELLRPAGVLIRHHHEAWDGSGFPERLSGTEIPLGARIIALANFVDHRREDHAGAGGGPILAAVRGELGRRFDPGLLQALETVLQTALPAESSVEGLVRRTLDPKELREGMVLRQDLFSPSGLLLLGRGARLDRYSIGAILRYHQLDPFTYAIGVLVPE